ncbi:hypothetical protein [Lachnoanaerobaculum umeaense]|jgi:hypothetical protein|uniref:Uncharacterized protein n=1 Tax=Lachnoanaerobaculum umeaense TaxID=617123 RepID=A0A385Q598_9FIRM|nr:hypothetical protein [Lachnoanaerobaculum umeaense]AYB00194.1 hypothetical protein D4A81_09755 [Lachnoanaerobaculum umeaense]PZW96772.1 hypothetical protein C7439_11199 [Lachnoanaerobaculum umeaense]DAV12975.1 MAG TPA: ribosomal protein L9 [Caudoviricetes sp.]
MNKETMIGRTYSSFTAEEQREIDQMVSGAYYGTTNEIDNKRLSEVGEYQITIDLENGLSVAGTLSVTEDEVVEYINDDGTFYNPAE